MAIMDYRAQLLDGKSMVGAVAATITEYSYDFGAANPNYGRAEPVYLHARVGTAVTSASPSITTLALVLQHAGTDSAASYSDLINMNLAAGSSMTVTLLTAGKLVYSAAMPAVVKRYVRIKATVAGTPITAGTVDAWLVIGALPTTYG